MADDPAPLRGVPVPDGRLARLARIGGMAGGIAGGMVIDGLRQMAAGGRPSLNDLLLTPANARKLTDHLARMRGAAMKVGQLLSMDAGEVLPPELAAVLARLRADADPMPPKQVQTVLNAEWGKGWISRFARFDVRPIAAASIGQVHRARTRDGRDLAIKVQYPGIRNSIDSDVSNLQALMRMSGAVPASVDLGTLMAEARRQLHEEADYAREGAYLARFGALLADAPDYQVPGLHADFCTPNVLAMDYVDSVPVETLADAPPPVRNRVASQLITLFLRELFEFGLIQSDPNFANYRHNPRTGQLVLLDFGATRAVPGPVAQGLHRLMTCGLAEDAPGARAAAMALGLFDAQTPAVHQETVMAMIGLAMGPLRGPLPFDFAASDLASVLRDRGMALAGSRTFWHIPPVDVLFVQRKVAGMYLLCSRLGAVVDVAGLVAPHARADIAG